jgi:hypothetical protein
MQGEDYHHFKRRYPMSQRHRNSEFQLPPKQELRAHAHGERHRIHVQLDQLAHELSSGTDPVDVHEPGEAWKPMRHRDAERAKTKLAKAKRNRRHWKTKMWKRRTVLRQKRIAAIERLA